MGQAFRLPNHTPHTIQFLDECLSVSHLQLQRLLLGRGWGRWSFLGHHQVVGVLKVLAESSSVRPWLKTPGTSRNLPT